MDTTTIIEQIQARGERITLSRRLVIDALGHTHEHLTINDIQGHIQAQNPAHPVSDTTVYRILQWLKDLGWVSQTDMGQTGIVYALMSDPCHHHLICLTCGATITIEDAAFVPLREQLSRDYGFEVRVDHMAIYGQCAQCRQEQSHSCQ
ncbi:MAG: transcriptional repressor [Anaerolineaceae bacterium]|nr:transcriptional repressor [Anaerolineaceae bacterium]